MPNRDIVAIGASAGGIEALRHLIAGFSADLPASFFLVQHVASSPPSLLAEILARDTALAVAWAKDGERVERGRIYVAPPDRHLLLEPEVVRIQRGPRQNRHRPAIDPLFRSAAQSYAPRCIGVVLSGALDDGVAGLRSIKQAGGLALVQDPSEAAFPSMPQTALARVDVDHCLPVRELARLLGRLTREEVPEPTSRHEVEDALQLGASLRPTNFGCPSCGGVLWESQDSFRCHVGHVFAPESLRAEQEFRLEDSLWVAIRTLEENAVLKRRMAARYRERDFALDLVERTEEAAALADFHAQRLREVLDQVNPRGEG